MFSFFLCFCLSNVLGFDIAGDCVRASLITNGQNIEILNSLEEERKFSTILTVIPNIGSSNVQINSTSFPSIINETDVSNFTFLFNDWNAIKKYPNSTIRYSSPFIAKVPTEELVNLMIKRRIWGIPSLFINDRLMIAGLLPETGIHRAFVQINDTVMSLKGEKGKTEHVAIAVPDFYPQQERDSIKYMAKSVNYKPFIVGQMKALSMYYSYNNARNMNSPKNIVIFFNFGETNLQISAVMYKKLKNQTIHTIRKEYSFDDTIGGRDVDVLIADFIAKQFQHKITAKAEQILLIEAEKIKKKLTVIKKVVGVIESLDGVNDLLYNITYDDYKKLLNPITESIAKCAKKVLKGIDKKKINRIMLVGGSSRIPIVQDQIKEIFETNQIYTSMLKDEMVATAAAMFQASMSPDYSLPHVIYEEKPIYEVVLRTKDSIMPFNGALPYKNTAYWLQCDGSDYPSGSSPFMIYNIAGESTTMKQTKDGLWRFKKPLFDRRQAWVEQLLEVSFSIEQQEFERNELHKLVNEMEYLLLETKDRISSDTVYSTEKEREMLNNAYVSTNKWFFSQKIYEKEKLLYRKTMLENAVGNILCRAENAKFLPQEIKKMEAAFKQVRLAVKEWSYSKRRPKREEIRNLLRMMKETEIWFEEENRKQSKITPLDTPILPFYSVKERTQKLLDYLNEIYENMNQKNTNSRI